MLGVGARNIQLVSRDPRRVLQYADHLGVIFGCVAEYVGENSAAKPAKRRQLFTNERPHPHVLQPDGIDHSTFGFEDPRWRITHDRLTREPFDYDATNRVEISNLLKL